MIQWRSDSEKLPPAKAKPELLLPERGEARPERGVGQSDRDQRRQQQQDARGRSPAREVERRRAHPMAERPQHRVGKRAFVPRSVVAAAIDEESRREQRAARGGAGLVRVHPRLCPNRGRIVRRPAIGGYAEIAGDGFDIVLGQNLRPGHELDVLIPESLRVGGALDQLGGAAGKLDSGQRPVAKDVAHAIAELVAHLGDALVGRAAIGAGVAAIFDQRDGGARRPKDVVEPFIDRPIEPIGRRQLRHADTPSPAHTMKTISTGSF